MPRDEPAVPFFLIVTDHDRGVFPVEGPMTDDRGWNEAATYARNHHHRIVCGPSGADRDALAAEFSRTHKLAGVDGSAGFQCLEQQKQRSFALPRSDDDIQLTLPIAA
jgi:hypothetical protein